MPFAAVAPLLDFCVEHGLEVQSLQFGYDVSAPMIACPIGDFYDTACAIAQCELVITVDTSVGHLAGTLGKPTWLLLPFSAEWRWLQRRTDTPWYPSMTLFRQSQPDDWTGLVARVVDRLRLGAEDAA